MSGQRERWCKDKEAAGWSEGERDRETVRQATGEVSAIPCAAGVAHGLESTSRKKGNTWTEKGAGGFLGRALSMELDY